MTTVRSLQESVLRWFHRARVSQSRGQAMVEYSVINWALIIALVLMSTVHIIPGAPGGPKMNVIELFLKAYQQYYNSYYYVLNLPFP